MELKTLNPARRKHYPVSDRIEEKMDAARYKCRIYHMYSIWCIDLHETFGSYARMMSRGKPYVHFLKPLHSGNYEGLVYVFASLAQRDRFLEENRNYEKLHKLTKERKML